MTAHRERRVREPEMLLLELYPRVKRSIFTRIFDSPSQIGVDPSGCSFDVEAAWGIVNKWNPEKRKSRLRALLVGRIPLPSQRRAVASIDISIPVLVANVGDGPILIDGRHRQQKAAKERIRTIPAFLLTIAESKRITKKRRVRREGL